jgi:hypothetical protein
VGNMSDPPKASAEEVQKDINDAVGIVERELNTALENLANWHNLELHYGEIEYRDGKATINLRFL